MCIVSMLSWPSHSISAAPAGTHDFSHLSVALFGWRTDPKSVRTPVGGVFMCLREDYGGPYQALDHLFAFWRR